MKFRVATLFAAAALSLPASAFAAKWESVATSGTDRVEIDRSRVTRPAANAATAWSRLVRDGIYIDDYGMRYTTIEAFNRYDCAKGSFTTLKRVWRRDEQLVREEPIAAPRELTADAGSPDARMLTEVCGKDTVAAREGKPGMMRADMLTADESRRSRSMPVADVKKPPEAAPTEQPSGKKRFFELPAIDKSKLEDPHAPMAAKDGKAVEPPKDAKPAKPAKVSDVQDLAKAAAAAAAESAAAGVSRKELERQYATSGPRPPKKKKAAPKKLVEAEPMIAAPAPVERKHIHWSYDGEGGPDHWNKLEAKYATCGTGRRQSPIDIRDGIKVDLEPITFNYNWAQFRIIDNGHTVQINVGEGNSIAVMGRTFQLLQFHFHRPSEEKVHGKTYDMVAHLVHKDDDGRLAVIAVLMSKGTIEHQLIQSLWNNMPLEANQEVAPSTTIDLNRILPEKRDYYTYMGSLTTPPCTEDVLWMVFKQPINVSDQQVGIFSKLYKHNARPTQPANDRLVKESR